MASQKRQELRIHDVRPGGDNLLIPLSELVQRLEKAFPNLKRSTWTILSAAAGYGETICQMEDQLLASGPKDVSGLWLAKLLAEDIQYFDDLDIRVDDIGIEFGIHDSTFLYFRGPNEVIETVAVDFEETEINIP